MTRFLDITNHVLFYYYVACNLTYLSMLILALKMSAAHQRRLESIKLSWITGSPLAPPITLLVPAHNEEKSITVALKNLLDLDYPELEVIAVNDGSADGTLAEMQREFLLRPVRAVYVPEAVSAAAAGTLPKRYGFAPAGGG